MAPQAIREEIILGMLIFILIKKVNIIIYIYDNETFTDKIICKIGWTLYQCVISSTLWGWMLEPLNGHKTIKPFVFFLKQIFIKYLSNYIYISYPSIYLIHLSILSMYLSILSIHLSRTYGGRTEAPESDSYTSPYSYQVSIYLSLYLSINLHIYIYISHPSIYLSRTYGGRTEAPESDSYTSPYSYQYLSIYLSIHLSIYLSI